MKINLIYFNSIAQEKKNIYFFSTDLTYASLRAIRTVKSYCIVLETNGEFDVKIEKMCTAIKWTSCVKLLLKEFL